MGYHVYHAYAGPDPAVNATWIRIQDPGFNENH